MDNVIGPVEYIVLAFPGNRFNGEIVPALAELVENKTVRIIDLAFVKKDVDGTVTTIELDDMDDDEAGGLGRYGDVGDLLNDDDIARVAEELEFNSSAAVLVWENTWAARFAASVRNANGVIVDEARIPHDIVEAALDWAASNEE